MDENIFDGKELVSSYHLTYHQNAQLRILLNDCNRLAFNGQLSQWRWKLDIIQRELNFDLMRLDDKLKDENKYSKRLEANQTLIKALMVNKKLNKIKKHEEFYSLLSDREKILRELQEKSGKGTKRTYADDDDDE